MPASERTPPIDDETASAVSDFCEDAWDAMESRMYQAANRGWGLSWRDGTYADDQVLARLQRAVDHLGAALRNTDDPQEWRKRAADVANQAFMAADPQRRASGSQEDRQP